MREKKVDRWWKKKKKYKKEEEATKGFLVSTLYFRDSNLILEFWFISCFCT